ncbi:ATP-binding protein [Kinneretia aquatilis]|uniref:ATP-binding protein n=1 Tax=Kinneretia aquatilis TaxID=2070761 RepID=UPI0014952FFD|nr:ATP-binding protein [Paucibacter aquatile]WIV99527.1 ATP-binding protein [Paucibacter aquatile]
MRLALMPIRRLSVLLIMAVCVGSLLLSSVMHAWYEARGAREALGFELSSLATLLGNRSTAAIAFDDSRTAEENLAALREIRHVAQACLYGSEGALFARFERQPEQRCAAQLPAAEAAQSGLSIEDAWVRVRQPIHLDEQKVAVLAMASSLEAVHQRLWRQLQLQAGVVLLAALLALAVSLRMQRLISQPLLALGQVARNIVQSRDYRLRAPELMGPLELGQLAQSFNRLMATIEQQNQELEAGRQAAQGRLERLRASQRALSGLAKSEAVARADLPALVQALSLAAGELFPGCRVRVGLPESPQAAAPTVAAGLAHAQQQGERSLAVAHVVRDERLSTAQAEALRAAGVMAFLWAAAGASPAGQLVHVCLERGEAERHWSADDIAVLCEMADLLALVERDSQRRGIEASLRDSEAYNKLLFRESCMPQGLLDPQSLRLLDGNRAAAEAFGLPWPEAGSGEGSAEAAPGLAWAQLDLGALLPAQQADGSDSLDRLSEAMAEALAGGRHVLEMQLLRRGEPAWEAEVHLDRWQSGQRSLLQFSLIDVSARVQAQRALEQLNAELETRVARRTQALLEANHQLSETLDTLQKTKDELVRNERLASLGALVAGVAHELNTPIGNSLVVASTLQEHSAHLSADVAAGTLRRSSMQGYLDLANNSFALLMRSLQRAAELVARFKQMAEDTHWGRRCRFDLAEALMQWTQTLQPQFTATPHRLLTELEPGIEMDSWPEMLEQVLSQLISNTLIHAHRPERPGTTRLQLQRLDGQRVRLSVSDDGWGIDARSLPRIFDPFFTTRLGSGGNGLGLHRVFSLVNGALGGRIMCSSEPGQGSVFVLELPCVAPQADSLPGSGGERPA